MPLLTKSLLKKAAATWQHSEHVYMRTAITVIVAAGGFFDGQTNASERHAFMVQLLQDSSTTEQSHDVLTAAEVPCASSDLSLNAHCNTAARFGRDIVRRC